MVRMLAALLMTLFYGAYFIKQISLKRQGIQSNRLAKGRKPAKTVRLEKALLFATYAIALIQYLSVLFGERVLPLALPAGFRALGIALMAAGLLLFVLALTAMRSNWRAGIDEDQKTAIVSKGVYRISRNPAFVGFDLLYIGTALAVPNVIMLAAALVGILLLHMQIRQEERYLQGAFGEEYRLYKGRTARYFLFF